MGHLYRGLKIIGLPTPGSPLAAPPLGVQTQSREDPCDGAWCHTTGRASLAEEKGGAQHRVQLEVQFHFFWWLIVVNSG